MHVPIRLQLGFCVISADALLLVFRTIYRPSLFLFLTDPLEVCCEMLEQFPDFIPTQTWGSVSKQEDKDKWGSNNCDDVVGGSSKANCQGTIKYKQWIT